MPIELLVKLFAALVVVVGFATVLRAFVKIRQIDRAEKRKNQLQEMPRNRTRRAG
jgi:hypothetical protein